MIKINLIAVRVPKEHKFLHKQFFILCGLAFLALLVSFAVKGYASGKMAKVEKQLQVAKTELQRLQTVAKRMKELESKKERREQILQAIKDLQDLKAGPTGYLDALNVFLPPDIWVTQIKDVNHAITITGFTFSAPAVADLMRSLESSELFFGTELKEIQKTTFKNEVVKSFSLTSNWAIEKEEDEEKEKDEKGNVPKAGMQKSPDQAKASGKEKT